MEEKVMNSDEKRKSMKAQYTHLAAGTIKQMCGNDTIHHRDLFEKGQTRTVSK
jgi:hypothetical protein